MVGLSKREKIVTVRRHWQKIKWYGFDKNKNFTVCTGKLCDKIPVGHQALIVVDEFGVCRVLLDLTRLFNGKKVKFKNAKQCLNSLFGAQYIYNEYVKK